MVSVKAAQDLTVDGFELSQSLPSLIMEATTIRLSNVDFPAATQVQLNSLKGPIDGRYPNFGTAIPASEQLGRVNFLNNVKSGGNLLMDSAAFDQFGGKIGKLPDLIGKTFSPVFSVMKISPFPLSCSPYYGQSSLDRRVPHLRASFSTRIPGFPFQYRTCRKSLKWAFLCRTCANNDFLRWRIS